MTLFIPRAAQIAAALLFSVFAAACAQSGSGPAPDAATTASASEAATEVTTNVTEGCVDSYTEGTNYFPDQVSFEAASGVRVDYQDSYKTVEVDTVPGEEPIRYVLVQCGAPEPELEGQLADAQIINVPVESVITLTTTNLPHFALLEATDRVVGVGTGAFVTTPEVLEGIESGDIPDYAGPEGEADVEAIIGAAPDLLVQDAFGETVVEDAQRFIEGGVPTVLNADFNEQTLLGRAEWLKFTSLFLNAEAAASEHYDEVVANYEEVKQAAAEADERPTVFANTPFEGTWFMPAGNSFFATAVADANGEYVFDDEAETASLQLDIETVLDRAADADVWVHAGSVNGTLDDLLAVDERFDEFKAFRKGDVWAYDKITTEGGGNAYFETAYTEADVVLSDLVKILHPDVLPDHELVYLGQVPGGKGSGN